MLTGEDNLRRYDVAILGGGPAGAAVALSLRKHAPSLAVAIFESSNYDEPRIGETLPPTVQPLLAQLGVWESFLAENHLPAYGTQSAWGGDELESNEFIYGKFGRGWHLDRRRFDAMLAREAEMRGVDLFTASTVAKPQKPHDGRWRLTVRSKDNQSFSVAANFVVDATGKRASFATRQGAQKILFDQLLGAFVFLKCGATTADSCTLVEAAEDGWWYSALLPGSGIVAAWMSDADIVRRHRLKDANRWFEQMQKTVHTKHRLLPAEPLNKPELHAAYSHRLDRVTGDRWLAVGDAAMAFDPLSSQGVFKALRSGILASYAICDFFKGDSSGLEKYQSLAAREFDGYLKTRAEFYGQERRWPDSPFWQRRHEQVVLQKE
ncbi:MAG: tryptophan 7-halogenase [Acidobacteriota bacterium]